MKFIKDLPEAAKMTPWFRDAVARWMKENMGIDLIVKSQKTKKDG